MLKHSIWFLVAGHWRAVARDPHTDALQPLVVLFAAAVPIVSSMAWAFLRLKGVLGGDVIDLGFILTAVSILAGFLFGLMTWIFQLRRDYTPSPVLDWTDASIPKLLDQTFRTTTYGALLAGVTVAWAIPRLPLAPGVALVQEAVVVGLIIHLAITLLMLLRRLGIAYDKLSSEKDRAEKRVRETATRGRPEIHH